MLGSLPASLVPTIVIIEDRASERLLTASKVTAMEPDTIPTNALKDARNTLAMMPIILVFIMTLSLLFSIKKPFYYCKNVLAKNISETLYHVL